MAAAHPENRFCERAHSNSDTQYRFGTLLRALYPSYYPPVKAFLSVPSDFQMPTAIAPRNSVL